MTVVRVADWRAAADPEDLREYDRFGPWIDDVRTPTEMPRRFRPWYPELAGATFLLKLPRDLDRAQARPGMDLYRAVLAVFADRLTLLRLGDGEVSRNDLDLTRVVATNTHTNLLIGRWTLLVGDGTSLDVDFNSVSQQKIAEVDRYVRRRPVTDERPSTLLPAVPVADHFFGSILATLSVATDDPLRPVHVEQRGRPCRNERLRPRVSTGVMLLESPAELVIVNRGEAARSRFGRANYASNVLSVAFAAMTSFRVVTPSAEPAGQFHRLEISCDRQLIVQPCLDRPDAVASLLAARGIRQA